MLGWALLLQGLVVVGVTGLSRTCRDMLLMRCDTFPPHPLCASDGTTYSNDCEYVRALCKDSSIHAIRRGPCVASTIMAEKVVLALACPDVSHVDCDSQPSGAVCGNNGRKYANMCHFEKARCSDHTLHQKSLAYCLFHKFLHSWT